MLKMKIDFDQGAVWFSGKPNEAIRQTLKAYGFRWNKHDAIWERHRGNTWEFMEYIEKQVDKTNGVRRPDGPCWKCKDPNGFFRAYGAATPVYCDSCDAERRAQHATK